jgi:uncharacterized SAM-binding protein YcdF (DUF218 family)
VGALRRVGKIAGAALVGATLLAAAFAGLYGAVDRQAARDETRRADAIVVLGSAVWPGGRPSTSLRLRTEHAISLYKQGYASTLFLTGGVGRFPPSEAAVMRRMALAAGVPESALVMDETATSTQESADNAAREAQARGWKSVLVVSEPFHMLRSSQMLRDAGSSLRLEAYASPVTESPLHRVERLRRYYTSREALALAWYFTAGRLL